MANEEEVKSKKTKKTKDKTKKSKVKKEKKTKSEEPEGLTAPAEPSDDDTIHLKFTISGCRNLLKGDIMSSDPYVKLLLGATELLKTKRIMKT